MPQYLKRYKFLVLFCLIAVVFVYQNCAEVNLKLQDNFIKSEVDASKVTYLKLPEEGKSILRAAFFVDMSRSMVSGPCAGDMDVSIPGANINAVADCKAPSGVDNTGKRFEIIKKWVDKARQDLNAKGITDTNALKVIIIPFSHDMAQRHFNDTRYSSEIEVFRNFVPKGKLKQGLDYLSNIQNPSNSRHDSIMATSVPASMLQRLEIKIKKELELLEETENLANVHFEVAFLSDGVPKPHIGNIKALARELWSGSCQSRCSYKLGLYLLDGNKRDCGTCIDEVDRFELDDERGSSIWGRNFREITQTWGDVSENTNEYIFYLINQVKLQFLRKPQVQYRFNFVRVNAENNAFKTQSYDLNANRNWLNKAKTIYPSRHRHEVLLNKETPFDLFTAGSAGQSYQLATFYALNLSVKPNSNNAVSRDSDNDGVMDIHEMANSTESKNPRTNGVCLDAVVKKTGNCIQEFCDPEVDRDNDGLNECDEKTLLTSDLDFDSDEDSIPDYLEVTYGFNPREDDMKIDSNSDGVTNFNQFVRGLGPTQKMSSYEKTALSNPSINFHDFKIFKNSNGDDVSVAGYKISFEVPMITTSEVNYTNKNDNSIFELKSRGANVNDILLLGKVINVQKPSDFFWVGKRVTLDATKTKQQIQVDLSQIPKLDVIDPKWED